MLSRYEIYKKIICTFFIIKFTQKFSKVGLGVRSNPRSIEVSNNVLYSDTAVVFNK